MSRGKAVKISLFGRRCVDFDDDYEYYDYLFSSTHEKLPLVLGMKVKQAKAYFGYPYE